MPEPLATVQELEARLGWALSEEECAAAEAVLEDVSAVVRSYGLPWPTADSAPDVVRAVVLSVAERKVRNPEGYRSEIEGSYQYHLPASAPTGIALSETERALVLRAAGIGAVYSVPVASLGGPIECA